MKKQYIVRDKNNTYGVYRTRRNALKFAKAMGKGLLVRILKNDIVFRYRIAD